MDTTDVSWRVHLNEEYNPINFCSSSANIWLGLGSSAVYFWVVVRAMERIVSINEDYFLKRIIVGES
jgi:hypothetical protein